MIVSLCATLVARGLLLHQPMPPSVTTPPIVPVETLVSNEEKSELEKLSSQAIQYELKGDFWNALQTYYKIKKVDPLYPRVDIKIRELEREQSPKPVAKEQDGKRVTVGIKAIPLRLIGGVIIAVLGIAFAIWAGMTLLNNLRVPVSELTRTSQPNTTLSPAQTSISATSAFGIGSSMISEKDGMTLLYVPAGEFTMGSENSESDEKPVHTVDLDAFWIDKTEVTNAMYARCVNANQCNSPALTSSSSRSEYFGNPEYDNYPVIYVSWNDANAYCAWVDRRLPNEAEWEKAARADDARTYPWGDDAPNNNLLNYNHAVGDTTVVGKYLDGKSIYGALDMAGNVWEWVADWHDSSYYGKSSARNPPGPISGTYRVLRGGSWVNIDGNVRSANRVRFVPADASYSIGFRCSRSQ